MKTIILSLTILFLSLINSFAQYEGLERSTSVERERNYFSKPALIDSTQLDSIITEYVAAENIPGATGLIFKSDGEIIWSGKYGYRNLEHQLPVEDSTIFLMASISKTFVATAIMQLWQSGLINLDGNINDYLPAGFTVVNPNHPTDTITVKMLMLHTSSLRDNWGILWPLWDCGDYPVSVDSFLINYFTPGGSYYSSYNFYNYSPGSTWNYSNSGSCLLGLIVKNITGKNFDEYIKDSVFTPLSMNSSTWFLEGMDTNKIATPYINNPPQAMCQIGMAYWPIGQLRTSTVELYNFALAYLNDGIWNNQRILDSTTIAFILSYHGVSTPWGTQGLIWRKDSDVYYNIWGHDGAFVGTQTGMYICVDENWGILFFINRGHPNYSPRFFPVLAQMANYAAYIIITDVEGNVPQPLAFSLYQNYPNPFNSNTKIKWQLKEGNVATLKVYDILGREVSTLVNEYKPSGKYEIEFNASLLPSGVYFYQLKAGSFVETKKMILMK